MVARFGLCASPSLAGVNRKGGYAMHVSAFFTVNRKRISLSD